MTVFTYISAGVILLAPFLKAAAFVTLTLYGCAMVTLIFALFKKTNTGNKEIDAYEELPGVSIVIPFRNEEHNLARLIESLEKQTYKGATEVILVNDQSEDNWENIINKHCKLTNHITLKIIDLYVSENQSSPKASLKLTSKQQALDLGVDNAAHRLILFTDADMILSPDWISTLVNTHLMTGADLVFGHTAISNGNTGNNKKSFLALMEAYQLEYLFSFAYAFDKLNLTGSCMGNNALVTKSAYCRIGGQKGIGYSIVEDRALLDILRKSGFKTSASEPFKVTAETYPSLSAKHFYNQMMRWAKGGLRTGSGLFFAGLLLLAQKFTFIVSVSVVILPVTELGRLTVLLISPAIICLSIANFLLTWIFHALTFKKNGAAVSKRLFPIHYLFMIAEIIVFGLSLILARKIRWKDRKM